ncbi:MAG: hypothetical protein ABIR47_11610, partial [Candidatus Kapaibacterium sp.]
EKIPDYTGLIATTINGWQVPDYSTYVAPKAKARMEVWDFALFSGFSACILYGKGEGSNSPESISISKV